MRTVIKNVYILYTLGAQDIRKYGVRIRVGWLMPCVASAQLIANMIPITYCCPEIYKSILTAYHGKFCWNEIQLSTID